MRKRYYSILKIRSYKTFETALVVCETLNDEKDIMAIAQRLGDVVTMVSTFGEPVFLNDYEFVDG